MESSLAKAGHQGHVGPIRGWTRDAMAGRLDENSSVAT